SFGVGDFGDLYLLIDWAKATGQTFLQLLPLNDTTATYTWRDSYPYAAISAFALHPMYICTDRLLPILDKAKAAAFDAKRQELERLPEVDYENVNKWKLAYCREEYKLLGLKVWDMPDIAEFFKRNISWIFAYAVFSYYRDMYGTADTSQWGKDAVFNPVLSMKMCLPGHPAAKDTIFYMFVQYLLYKQFDEVATYARKQGVVLKGDLPVGIGRYSSDTWCFPQFFHLDGQAGAPPDDFSATGQNWGFPTYNWENFKQTNYRWWKQRFAMMEKTYDAFRIDHILGFFRIWEVPLDYVQGLCGHFDPALPLSKEEIEAFGLPFNEKRFTTAHINVRFLPALFGENTEQVKDTYLAQSSSHHFVLKPFCDTQRKIQALFQGKDDPASCRIRDGLMSIANECLFLHDPKQKGRFHPRIAASGSYIYSELAEEERAAFDRLYEDFFYHRHNDFWKRQAEKHLDPLLMASSMLPCGEDLGMIPASVPEVMNKFQILSLEIERMPKTPGREFADVKTLPYRSVCTTSTHDMPPLRYWWDELGTERRQRYYNQVLGLQGEAPCDCTPEIARLILKNHLDSPSMLAIFPLQDWLAMDGVLRRADFRAERINVPSEQHYWRYRMHLCLEDLLTADDFNTSLRQLIRESGR
ncbi:MAG: 4-alpha-glucanotransferase, partial [Tannerella sp.]|nr:4-alpha-glucanotransferase [Tannerella sp.]